MKLPLIRYLPFIFIALFFMIPIIIWFGKSIIFMIDGLLLFSQFLNQLIYTFIIAILSSIFSVLFAYPLAYIWWKTKGTVAKSIISISVFTPVTFGLLTRNFSWIGLLSDTGLHDFLGINTASLNSLLYNTEIVIIVMVYLFIPLAYFVLIQGMQSINIYSLYSAQSMGATFTEIFLKVILVHQ